MVEIMEKLIEVTSEVIFIRGFSFGATFFVCGEERFWNASEHASDCKTMKSTIVRNITDGETTRALTLLRCVRNTTPGQK